MGTLKRHRTLIYGHVWTRREAFMRSVGGMPRGKRWRELNFPRKLRPRPFLRAVEIADDSRFPAARRRREGRTSGKRAAVRGILPAMRGTDKMLILDDGFFLTCKRRNAYFQILTLQCVSNTAHCFTTQYGVIIFGVRITSFKRTLDLIPDKS